MILRGFVFVLEDIGVNHNHLNEDFLTDKLSGEEKKRFIQYVDAWATVNGESTLDSFITGFRLGAQFAFDTFVTSKAPYTDYLKDEI